MKFAYFTLQYSVFFMKTNFVFMVILQIVKLILNKENRNSTINGSELSFFADSNPDSSFQAQTNSIVDSTYTQAFSSKVKDFVISFVSTFSYDVKQLEATKTEIINIMKVNDRNMLDINNKDNNYNLNPSIISESYINFKELLQFSNLNHIIKLTYLFNLNLNCILLNLTIISFFIIKLKKNYDTHNIFNKKFFKINLLLANFAFFILISIDSLYMIFLKSTFNSNLNAKDSNAMFDYVYNYVKDFEKTQPLQEMYETQVQNKEYISFESSFSSKSFNYPTVNSSCKNYLLTTLTLNINIIILLVSICTLSFYSYLIKIDTESSKSNSEEDAKPLPDLNQYNDDNNESKLKLVKYLPNFEKNVFFNEISNSSNERFIRKKQKNAQKKSNFDLQIIINCFYGILLLSIWDMTDVYQYFRASTYNNMNHLLQKNSSYQNFLSQVKDLNENLSIVKNEANDELINLSELKNDQSFNGKINVLSNYFNKYDGDHYQHIFSHRNDQQYVKKELDSSIDKQYKTITQIKAMCVFKIHSQLLGDILILFITFVIICKLKTMEQFIKWNSKDYLKYFRQKQEINKIITL